jgi:hypothetical protein
MALRFIVLLHVCEYICTNSTTDIINNNNNNNKWPHPHILEGRPIVYDCGSESYHVCELTDFFLKLLATQHEYYIRDSYDFINKIRD